ncbi:hypothetical protein DFH09DRAFT_355589 [Mycena vulgaris]|nr:hypothetical protein DFH09DRAFT_355589 [Mycena vulgaris]
MAPNPAKKSGSKRHRNEFTESEDQHIIEFLAGRSPDDRTSVYTYREVVAQPWGSKHNEDSWLARYRRRKSYYDPRIDALVLKKPSGSRQ